ncbi:membrane protein [Afipia sp. P52-10]|uniref:YeiH family protein n=1 Tax=Afipia sp. P52-10 TaxID=1429916 RepID=UPI0003DF1DA1|nr:putative sulfate exporter family transporter [Afipia sp. P52-10]ETR78339.1 membrane protein [Afipia sp. P52-10]
MTDIETPRLRAFAGGRRIGDILRLTMPGLLASVVVAIAATSLSEHYAAPVMLFALLLGMALNFLFEEGRCVAGINFAAKHVLRWSIALLGAQMTAADLGSLGVAPIGTMVAGVAVTIAFGALAAPLLGLDRRVGALTGGAVAICGASAALAIAAILPKTETSERDTAFTVIGVTALSTLAMIIYPAIAAALHFDHRAAGIFLGGTIHDVAQVAGAGFSISDETGHLATLTKLFRVLLLLPAVYVLGLMFAGGQSEGVRATPAIPGFLIGFAALAALNSLHAIPQAALPVLAQVSRWGLVVAIAALGMKTSIRAVAKLGFRPVLLLVAETLLLMLLVIAAITWLPG